MTTVETRRAASVSTIPMDRSPLGTQPPRPTNAASTTTEVTSGGDTNHRQARHVSDANDVAPAGSNSTTGQVMVDTQNRDASGGPNSQQPMAVSESMTPMAAGSDGGQAANDRSASRSPTLLDPTLLIAAEIVDDLEKTRIANENRLRQLTRDETDKDGEERGFGLTESHPAVARVASIVDGIGKLEHEATLNLQRAMREHPLGPWVKAQRGIGEKQAARLLAAFRGDPYIRPELTYTDGTVEPSRPRTVSELRQYAGHGDPARSRRRKGQRVEHSPDAKMRTWNIVQSVIKAGVRGGQPITPWGEVYCARKAATVGKLHDVECVRCGPKNNPAKVGSPWSDAHRHADAIRITAKEILKGLWIESRRLHGESE